MLEVTDIAATKLAEHMAKMNSGKGIRITTQRSG